MYVTLDETSEREQLIEKEELLARQRIERSFSQSIDAVLGQRVLGTLTREEERYRTLLQTQMQNSRDMLFCLFREGLERRVVELHELQGRKSLASASATSTYYARRRASRFLQLHSSEEDGRRLVVMSERAERDDLRVLQQESLSRLTVTNNETLAQRSTTAEGKTPKAVLATAESAASTPGLSARVLSYLSTSRSAPTTTPGATPLDAAAVMELRDTEEEERAVLMVEEERNFLSHVRQRANAIHMEYLSQREAAVRQATEEMQNELRSLREELRRARRTSGSLSSHRAVEAMNSYSPPSPSRLSPNFSD
ncbi:hypothetical protein, conserved [Angomonas deanei]|uniref:Uncharacterized protein n=1 Tax=Angomonas deanei TaxID=59799 RepID=A0A7G2CS36_9TRYP|nr:hypothetical protein, conserved [Angomonas deanei]